MWPFMQPLLMHNFSPFFFMAATFYSYMLITFPASFSPQLRPGSDMFKVSSQHEARMLECLADSSVQTFLSVLLENVVCLRSGYRKCLCWPNLQGPLGAIFQQQEKCIPVPLSCKSRCAHTEEAAR